MKPRLTYVLNLFEDGAVPNILLDIAPYIIESGFEIEVVSLEPIPEDATCTSRARAIGMNVTSLNCGSRQIWCQFSRLRAYFRENRPDLVHSHLGRSDILSALSVPVEIPLVTTMHSVRANAGRPTMVGYRLTDSRVAVRTCLSHSVQVSWYDDWKLTSRNQVIYNPVDAGRLSIQKDRKTVRSELSVPLDAPLLFNAGRFIHAKGQSNLIAALPQIREVIPKAMLAIAGKGPLEEELRKTARDYGVENVVLFLGFRTDVADLINASDVVVFPSLWEGLGLVPIEAMLLERPVVASAIGSIMEFITDGVEGRLISPHDRDQLVSAVIGSLEGRDTLTHQIQMARARAEAMFSPEAIAQHYLTLYGELIRR